MVSAGLCIHRPDAYRVSTHVFMLRLSNWGSDAWDSSVHRVRHQSTPRLKGCHEAPDGSGAGVSLFPLLSNTQRCRHREMSKASTCHIDCLLSWFTVWAAGSSKSQFSHHTDLFPDFWEPRFPAFVCLAVRWTGPRLMMSSHSCEVICVCVCILCHRRSVLRTKHREVDILEISHRVHVQTHLNRISAAALPKFKLSRLTDKC